MKTQPGREPKLSPTAEESRFTMRFRGRGDSQQQRRRRGRLFCKVPKSGAPGQIRTGDLVLRRHTLYPPELRARRDDYLHSMYLTQPLTSTKFGCSWVQLREPKESRSPARHLPHTAAGTPHQPSPSNTRPRRSCSRATPATTPGPAAMVSTRRRFSDRDDCTVSAFDPSHLPCLQQDQAAKLLVKPECSRAGATPEVKMTNLGGVGSSPDYETHASTQRAFPAFQKRQREERATSGNAFHGMSMKVEISLVTLRAVPNPRMISTGSRSRGPTIHLTTRAPDAILEISP